MRVAYLHPVAASILIAGPLACFPGGRVFSALTSATSHLNSVELFYFTDKLAAALGQSPENVSPVVDAIKRNVLIVQGQC
jgi:hypothetical protein